MLLRYYTNMYSIKNNKILGYAACCKNKRIFSNWWKKSCGLSLLLVLFPLVGGFSICRAGYLSNEYSDLGIRLPETALIIERVLIQRSEPFKDKAEAESYVSKLMAGLIPEPKSTTLRKLYGSPSGEKYITTGKMENGRFLADSGIEAFFTADRVAWINPSHATVFKYTPAVVNTHTAILHNCNSMYQELSTLGLPQIKSVDMVRSKIEVVEKYAGLGVMEATISSRAGLVSEILIYPSKDEMSPGVRYQLTYDSDGHLAKVDKTIFNSKIEKLFGTYRRIASQYDSEKLINVTNLMDEKLSSARGVLQYDHASNSAYSVSESGDRFAIDGKPYVKEKKSMFPVLLALGVFTVIFILIFGWKLAKTKNVN